MSLKRKDILHISSSIYTHHDQSDPLLIIVKGATKIVLADKELEPVILESDTYVCADGRDASRTCVLELMAKDLGYKLMNYLLRE